MISSLPPRAVLVRRPSEYEMLVEQHGTAQQATFYLEHQSLSMDDVRRSDAQLREALKVVRGGIPRAWRSVEILRSELSQFVFEPRDIVMAIGQDGLVANVAKYLNGQRVIGVNPDPLAYEGPLVPHLPASVRTLLLDCAADRAHVQSRTMTEAVLDDGQRLLALNEIFVGHRSHQSARYRFIAGGEEEHQSSSGLIVSTGTGSTGWARSINLERGELLTLPKPEERALAFFVREAFPGSGFMTKTTAGLFQQDATLTVTSEMSEGGVIFGDGIEEDHLEFLWGTRLSVGVAREQLRLVR